MVKERAQGQLEAGRGGFGEGAAIETKETELADSKEELKQMKHEIALATQPVNAIMRSKELREMLPESVREEFERFVEIY